MLEFSWNWVVILIVADFHAIFPSADIGDLHTVFLACALTVAPLLGVFFSILGIRCVNSNMRKNDRNCTFVQPCRQKHFKGAIQVLEIEPLKLNI